MHWRATHTDNWAGSGLRYDWSARIHSAKRNAQIPCHPWLDIASENEKTGLSTPSPNPRSLLLLVHVYICLHLNTWCSKKKTSRKAKCFKKWSSSGFPIYASFRTGYESNFFARVVLEISRRLMSRSTLNSQIESTNNLTLDVTAR